MRADVSPRSLGGLLAELHELLETVEQSLQTGEDAIEPGTPGRADIIGLVGLLVTVLDRLAPAVVRALTDEDAEVRRAAAHAVRAILAVPAVAASARRAAEHHPDRTVRDLLAEKP